MPIAQGERQNGAVPTNGQVPFAHTALLYDGEADFLAGTVPFLEEGLDAGEPALVSVPGERLGAIVEALGPAARSMVRFVPMEDLGRNPAWIIPAWRDFVGPHLADERSMRGIGEPIWASRSDDELVECNRYESLLNLAMADACGFSLLCPYDISGLDDDVMAAAAQNHPEVHQGASSSPSQHFVDEIPVQLSDPLAPPPPTAQSVRFGGNDAWSVRRRLADVAAAAGLDGERLEDLAVAISEALTNSVEHGGGTGEILWWSEPDRFVCEIRDQGTIDDPLVGRVRPSPIRAGGRGMWLIHQLCDLVQIRVLPDEQKVIRLQLAT